MQFIVLVMFASAFENGAGDQKLLQEQSSVAALQDQAQLSLSKYIATAYPNQPQRFGKLLLMLPELKAINASTIEGLFFRKSIGSIPMERLLSDMYKSQDIV